MNKTETLKAIFEEKKFFLIAGPCAVESEALCFEVARTLKSLCEKYGLPFIFKASFRKANRTSLHSFSGIGDQAALAILKKVSTDLDIPVLTDVHETGDVAAAAAHVDVLQIPAFLCRQTDLLVAAGASGLPVNIKKGQFTDGASMKFALEKASSGGNKRILLTERGNNFGYNDMVVDMRNILVMQQMGCPVVFDGTHSVQRPNSGKGVTGGEPAFIRPLVFAAVATGADGLFLETHPDPAAALSDGSNMLPLAEMEGVLINVTTLHRWRQSH